VTTCAFLIASQVAAVPRWRRIAPFVSNREIDMSDDDDATGRVPLIQQLLDNPFLLLFIGVMVPMLVYIVWGLVDIFLVPTAK